MQNLLTEKEAREIVGNDLVDAVNDINCYPIGLLTDGTAWTGYTVFAADASNNAHRIRAIYLVDNEEAVTKDLDEIDWVIDGYEIETVI